MTTWVKFGKNKITVLLTLYTYTQSASQLWFS